MNKVTARRASPVFSLAFLDVMSCGFGAVVLVFLILNHEIIEEKTKIDTQTLVENRTLTYKLDLDQQSLAELNYQLEKIELELGQIKLDISEQKTKLLKTDKDIVEAQILSLSQKSSTQNLQSDINERSTEIQKLKAQVDANQSVRIREFEGDGDRQYLTGLRVAGKNIVIALDTSTSMLDETIVNVLIRRNKNEQEIKRAPKWQRSIRTVEWIGAQLPLDSEFQVYGFDENARSFLSDSSEGWVDMKDGAELSQAIETIKDTIPKGGTSLENLILKITSLSPLPDNVYLITDGLPTLSDRPARSALVTGRRRMEYFRDAVSRLPKQIPINVILFPMEGDPMAAAEYWNLARATNGAFISPSSDWP
ncbi:VWA domain-containing protein [Gammaproteobacteria bacterium]|nr:VWA domain-containing protein [Gammaproteobacteria bacterium]